MYQRNILNFCAKSSVWAWRSTGSEDLVQFEACIDNDEENGSGRVDGWVLLLVQLDP